jgi:hypothetical protein
MGGGPSKMPSKGPAAVSVVRGRADAIDGTPWESMGGGRPDRVGWNGCAQSGFHVYACSIIAHAEIGCHRWDPLLNRWVGGPGMWIGYSGPLRMAIDGTRFSIEGRGQGGAVLIG